jgi:hypothetical protein
VKHLAEILKGKIEVKDSKTGGALFAFTFSDICKEFSIDQSETAIVKVPPSRMED